MILYIYYINTTYINNYTTYNDIIGWDNLGSYKKHKLKYPTQCCIRRIFTFCHIISLKQH